MTHPDEFEFHYAVRPNKSEQKREAAALEDLAERLIDLPIDRLKALTLPQELREAVELARSIAGHHGAFKRQRKFIAKLMREMDVSPIHECLDRLDNRSSLAIHRLHVIERWRDRLLKGDDHDLNALMAEHPDADRQKLRQLIRDARKEHQNQTPPRSARLLFLYLRELISSEEDESVDGTDEYVDP
ncbi:MAG: ribosome biogenesis factor YjgA [Methylococcaceae bacterium]|nr:ribosome biogenesis factor YjgA [Methylococcaceae bacterium]